MPEKYLNNFDKVAKIALIVLAISIVGGYLASHHWIADILVNFQFQYAIGAAILFIWFLCRKKPVLTLLCLALACSATFQIYAAINLVKPIAASEISFKIVQYNRKYTIAEHSKLLDFIQREQPDVIVVQEAVQSHAEALITLQDSYPHQMPEPRKNAFGMVILSKHPFLQQDIKPFERIAIDNFMAHLVVQPPGFEPISIYTIHPTPPMSAAHQRQRNSELQITSMAAGNDIMASVIMLGDWNITPFSPYFRAVLENGNLRNEYTDSAALFSWPSFFLAPIFQIPIDHILHKGDIELVEKRRGPAMGSDHYPIIATFAASN